jgi:hypothetical protein
LAPNVTTNAIPMLRNLIVLGTFLIPLDMNPEIMFTAIALRVENTTPAMINVDEVISKS